MRAKGFQKLAPMAKRSLGGARTQGRPMPKPQPARPPMGIQQPGMPGGKPTMGIQQPGMMPKPMAGPMPMIRR